MTFSSEWDDFHANSHKPKGTYPHFEKLVRVFVHEASRMLELGAGYGGEIKFFAEDRKFGYHGIDGSSTAVEKLRADNPSVAERIVVGDFTKSLYFEDGFDLIVDRAAVAHNDLESIKSCIELVWKGLKPGGLFISADWFSTSHSELARGMKAEAGTRSDYPDGQFAGIGKVHFSSEAEIVGLFRRFEGLLLQERIVRRCGLNPLVRVQAPFHWISKDFLHMDYTSAVWDIVVRKPL